MVLSEINKWVSGSPRVCSNHWPCRCPTDTSSLLYTLPTLTGGHFNVNAKPVKWPASNRMLSHLRSPHNPRQSLSNLPSSHHYLLQIFSRQLLKCLIFNFLMLMFIRVEQNSCFPTNFFVSVKRLIPSYKNIIKKHDNNYYNKQFTVELHFTS